MSKFLYPIYKLNIESYKKWWLYHKKAGGSGVLSEILEGFSFNLANTLNRKFKLFEKEGNSVQDGTPSPDNEVPILSAGDNGSINEKITNADGTEEQDYSIFVQKPFRSNKDKTIKDKFVKVNGNWYERHYITEITLNGTENWSRSDTEGFVRYVVTLANMKSVGATRSANILCNKFKGSIENGYGNCFAFNNTVAFYVPENIENFSVWKNWLEENNVKLQYELAEPLDLPCTETQIQQLENLPSTYKEMTIINSEDETPAHLKIQYYKEG